MCSGPAQVLSSLFPLVRMKNILVVDNDRSMLDWLRPAMDEAGQEWNVVMADTAAEGERLAAKGGFDVLIANPSLPGLDAAQLFYRVMNSHPRVVRLAYCDQEEQDAVVRLLGLVHQCLAKPATARLCESLERALRLRESLASDRIQRLVSETLSLPSMPELYLELLEVLRQEYPSLDEVSAIVSRDLGMCTKILQLVNSAYLGLHQRVSSPKEAVLQLGMQKIHSLVLTLQFFSLYERVQNPHLNFAALWRHCWNTGTAARRIAQLETPDPALAEQAFVSGLLHDVGKLILAQSLPTEYQTATTKWRTAGIPLWQAEQSIFGVSHAEVGAYLLGLWGLPDALTGAVLWHHQPSASCSREFTPLTAVHVANVIEHAQQEGEPQATYADIDQSYLAALGRLDRLEVWRAELAPPAGAA